MKFIFGEAKRKEEVVPRALHGLAETTKASNKFVADQFKELVKRNLDVPVTRYHL